MREKIFTPGRQVRQEKKKIRTIGIDRGFRALIPKKSFAFFAALREEG